MRFVLKLFLILIGVLLAFFISINTLSLLLSGSTIDNPIISIQSNTPNLHGGLIYKCSYREMDITCLGDEKDPFYTCYYLCLGERRSAFEEMF